MLGNSATSDTVVAPFWLDFTSFPYMGQATLWIPEQS